MEISEQSGIFFIFSGALLLLFRWNTEQIEYIRVVKNYLFFVFLYLSIFLSIHETFGDCWVSG